MKQINILNDDDGRLLDSPSTTIDDVFGDVDEAGSSSTKECVKIIPLLIHLILLNDSDWLEGKHVEWFQKWRKSSRTITTRNPNAMFQNCASLPFFI